MELAGQRSPLYRRPSEIARRISGALLEFAIKAYGGAAAVSVALSDAETVGGKLYDAAAALPNLKARYDQARYLVDHAEQIQGALDYVARNAPSADQIEAAIGRSQRTIENVRTVFAEVERALGSLQSFSLERALHHANRAWTAMPDLDSLDHLAQTAGKVGPALGYLQGLDLDIGEHYETLCLVADNFSSDEIRGSLGVMIVALGLAYGLATAIGFWARRGRPGFLVSALQRSGARLFPGWYRENLSEILGRQAYALARQHFDETVARDPESALSPRAYRAVEVHIRTKSGKI